MSVSALIVTLNEEANLPACLKSLEWCDDIVVLDSFSTDRTVEIAKAAGARVVQHAWNSESEQRMFGLTEIKYRYPWLYMPDADEFTPDDLRDELLAIAQDPSREEVLFHVRRKDMFMGRWLKHSSLYPTWHARFARPDRVTFLRILHSICSSDGPTGRLNSHMLHYSFNKGIEDWWRKHNRYSSVEASISADHLEERTLAWADFIAGDQRMRRDITKSVVSRLPFRPTLRFLYMYLFRGGFLDGWPGYAYCRMLASYELMIVVKTTELRRRRIPLEAPRPCREPERDPA